VKIDPGFAAAVSVTPVTKLKPALQALPQAIPDGALEIVPAPFPAFETDSVKVVGSAVNVAVTDSAALISTVQVEVPLHPPPLQPAKVEPLAGAAAKVTELPMVKGAEQVAPQAMPEGALVTAPAPVPALKTDSM
jgi:hypothetical protein